MLRTRTRHETLRAGLAVLVLAAWVGARPAAASEAAWQALRAGGTVAVMRHARAPGTGDPPGFRLDDCATQRNLSEEGREQSRRLGQMVRANGVRVAVVLSSRWCRALDTARAAFGDLAQPAPALDSFFGTREAGAAQTAEVRQLVADWRNRDGVLVLVTHQVNITALTGVFPAEGEIVVLAPTASGFDLVARLNP